MNLAADLRILTNRRAAVDDGDFAARIIDRLPVRYQKPVKENYLTRYRTDGRRAANIWLREKIEKPLSGAHLGHAGDDGRIRDEAARRARACRQASYATAVMYARACHVIVPAVGDDMTEQGVTARLGCERWWRRQLRKRDGRAVEKLGRELNLIKRGAQCYASDEAVWRRRGQKARTAVLLESLKAINETGQEFSVKELSDRGVSNPALRRAELMVRIRGFEEMAIERGHVGEFLTGSCPSRMHRAHAKSGQPNAKWDGTTPREAQRHLAETWARIRAALAREGIEPYGFRIAEPHHDGTPHWHLLLFVPPHQADRLAAIFRDYMLADSPTEPGALKHRVKRVTIDPAKGSAAGYVAKYVAKNIDGHRVERDFFGNDGADAAVRIDAWASTWGIRQFQQIGGPRVTAWRELRRLRDGITGALEAYRLAADNGNWRGFMRQWTRRPLALVKELTGELNRYGELAAPVIEGVTDGVESVKTRLHVWRVEFSLSGAQAPPWTCVNNCTG